MANAETFHHIDTQDHPVVEGRMLVHISCVTCDRTTTIDTAVESFNAWLTQQMLSQEIWPELPQRVRRWLTEAVCDRCVDESDAAVWDNLHEEF